eukprot:SAG31_NODE_3602_length_4080_cov_6.988194_1_plen_190_part_10
MPSYYTEYEANLGQAVADPVRVFPSDDDSDGKEEVWTREFEHGFAVVSSLTASNFSLKLGSSKLNGSKENILRPLPLSKNPGRISDQREAPAWQFIVDNDLQSERAVFPRALVSTSAAAMNTSCVCSAAAPACCSHSVGTPADWWADDARRAGFRIVEGNWTTVSDLSQSHQIGNSFAVSFVEPGPLPQG